MTKPILLSSILALLLRSTLCGNFDPQPCGYEETEITADFITPWDTRFGDDLAELVGPYEGTWRWEKSNYAVEIDGGDIEIPALAQLTVDTDSYRLIEPVGPFGNGVVCSSTALAADGVLTFTDEQGGIIVEIDVVVQQEEGGEIYISSTTIQPVSAFSDRVHPTEEYDVEGVGALVYWGAGGKSLLAEFAYSAQRTLSSSTGEGVSTPIAVFSQD